MRKSEPAKLALSVSNVARGDIAKKMFPWIAIPNKLVRFFSSFDGSDFVVR